MNALVATIFDRIRQVARLDPGLYALLAAVTLAAVGILAIGTVKPDYASKQTQWMVISILVASLCLLPNPRVIGLAAFPLMFFTIGLLVLLILPGVPSWIVPVRNGARCWIDLKFMMFQPSELAKIVFVLALARYLRFRESYRTLRGLLVPFVMMFVPVGLLLKQPDLGMSLLFPPALFAVLVAAGAKLRHLGTLVLLAVVAVAANVAIVLWAPAELQVLRPHQQKRIIAMISQLQGDTRYVQDIGYQGDKAMTLIGAGQFTGYGGERATTIIGFNRLPENHNDMIFVVVVNRWGFVGGLIVLGLFAVMILSILAVAERSKDPFVRLSCVGFAALLASQMVINVGMTTGLMPITGLTLPLVSYGGSSLLTTFVMMALVVNFASRRPAIITRPSFEFDYAASVD